MENNSGDQKVKIIVEDHIIRSDQNKDQYLS